MGRGCWSADPERPRWIPRASLSPRLRSRRKRGEQQRGTAARSGQLMGINRPHLKAFSATAAAAPYLGVPAETTISKDAMQGISPTACAEQEHGLRWLARHVAGK